MLPMRVYHRAGSVPRTSYPLLSHSTAAVTELPACTRRLQVTDVKEGGKSDTFSYLRGLENGDIATSRIKQVASGRFGVTPEFLVNADQLEIKIAQVGPRSGPRPCQHNHTSHCMPSLA
jgi:hypothetical protein